MANTNPDLSIAHHYLQVQALTPVESTNGSAPSIKEPISSGIFSLRYTTISIIIFMVLLSGGVISLIITRVRDLNKILMIMTIAALTSAIPLATSLVSNQTRLQSKAGPGDAPKNLVIYNVTSTDFVIKWETDKEEASVIRLRTTPQIGPTTKIISEKAGYETYTHIITVTDLIPNTIYYLEVLSGGNWYNHNSQPIQITTLAK